LAAVRVGGSFYTPSHCDFKSKYTYLRECPMSGCCTEHIKPVDVMECLAINYGQPPAEIGGDEPWPSLRNHAAGDVWFDLVSRSFLNNEFAFGIRNERVCAEVWRAAYDIPPATFESICASVYRGEATRRADTKVNVMMAGDARADEANAVNRATVWWIDRLRCYDAMPHQRGCINADHCVWQTVFDEEYVIECQIAGVFCGCISTWKGGQGARSAGAGRRGVRVRVERQALRAEDALQALRVQRVHSLSRSTAQAEERLEAAPKYLAYCRHQGGDQAAPAMVVVTAARARATSIFWRARGHAL
jgi:hypothetical protein